MELSLCRGDATWCAMKIGDALGLYSRKSACRWRAPSADCCDRRIVLMANCLPDNFSVRCGMLTCFVNMFHRSRTPATAIVIFIFPWIVLAYPLRSLDGKETSSGNNPDKCCCPILFPIKGGLAHPHILANLPEHRVQHYIRCNFRTILDLSCRVRDVPAEYLKSAGRLCWNLADNFYAQFGERQCCALR